MTTNYQPSGAVQAVPGSGYHPQRWTMASVAAHNLWQAILASQQQVQTFLAGLSSNEAVKFYSALTLTVTQADCDIAGCSSDFYLFQPNIINWTTTLALMQVTTYQP